MYDLVAVTLDIPVLIMGRWNFGILWKEKAQYLLNLKREAPKSLQNVA